MQQALEEDIAETDDDWDGFVSNGFPGNFEQSSAWARIREQQGWKSQKVSLYQGNQILAGFRIYTRAIGGMFTIGYVPKAPLVSSAAQDQVSMELLISYVKQKSIHLIVAQPPEGLHRLVSMMKKKGFLPNSVIGIIRADLIVDLKREMKQITADMRNHTRQEVRQAMKRGVSVRTGGDRDLAIFFDLMTITCRRQKTSPNPSSLEELRFIWQEFSRKESIHLLLAEYEGQPIGGVLILTQGERATFWKKGWAETHTMMRPNQLLFYEAIRWAYENGYKSCDFGALNRGIAEQILSGKPLTAEMMKSRDFFNLGFGGTPILLPEPMIFIPNPILRLCYQIASPVMGSSCIGRLIRYFSRIRRS